MMTMTQADIIAVLQEAQAVLAGQQLWVDAADFRRVTLIIKAATRMERERICNAIKAEDDYCVDKGDYMLDSDNCISVARGTWVRPNYELQDATIPKAKA